VPNFDIPLSVDLNKELGLPPCKDIQLKIPGSLKIQLPTGGSIKAINDLSAAIPTDCSLTFSLMLQLAPLLASMECVLKILKLLKPLVDVVTNLPVPPVRAVQEFAKAAVDLAPCFLIPTPANMLPFIRDILCLILKVLNCLLGQMKTLMAMMEGLQLNLDAARTGGNFELEQALQCAQDNAQASADSMMKAIEPVGVILDLIGPMMGLVGQQPITLTPVEAGSGTEGLNQAVQSVQGVVGTIQIVVDALGGCPS
jgi:hypothetical protein